jgi:plasmid maintenance system antidote protein VapI
MSTTPFQGIAVNNFYRQAPPMLGDRIRSEIMRLRAERGWSRPNLGARLRPPTSGQQIEKLEKGQRGLEPEWIERIAAAFGIEPEALILGEQRFELTEQVASEVAEVMARFVLRGDEPDQETVQGLAILIQDLSATFADAPEARRDPHLARPVVRALARRYGRRS